MRPDRARKLEFFASGLLTNSEHRLRWCVFERGGLEPPPSKCTMVLFAVFFFWKLGGKVLSKQMLHLRDNVQPLCAL